MTDPEAAINPGAGAQPVVTSFTYDPNGNQATVTDDLGHTTSYFYDEENRLVKTVFPAAAGESPGIHQTFYDGLGRRIREEDEAGTATEYVYDFRGLLQAVKLAVDSASPTVTQFRYDTLGNLITQEDAEKRVTYFEYDALGRRVKRILPGGSVQGFGYDSVAWQNQTLARSFVTNFNGQVIVITNDCMGRIMSKALPARPEAGLAAAWVSYAYNARGQLVQVQHTGGVTRTVQQAYDSRGDLRVKSTPEGTLSYSYNNFGELVCISARTNFTGWSGTTSAFEDLSVLNTNASSAVWNYQYDGQGRLSQVSSDSEVADATYAYSAVGSLATTTYRNGITSGYDYNPRNWLRRVRSTRGTALVANFDYDEAGTNAIAGVGGSSEWDSRRLSPTGQRRRVVEHLAESTRTVDYDYDALKRLVTETVRPSITGTPVGAASYQGTTPGTGYDRVGNRRSREVFGMPGLTTYAGHQFDERDRLNPGTEFGYDANGNTTNDNNGGTYLYDAEDRLIRFSKAGTTVEFAYDDSGNRVKKAVTRNDTTTVTRYLVEDRNPTGYAQVMEEIPDQSTVGLVGYWRFDEATGTTALDQSVNGYNGTLVNGPVRSSGRAGGAVTFDGVNDYIQVGAQPGLTVSAELTASAWIYLTGTGGSIINNEGQYALGVISGNLCWGVANEDPGWHWIGTGWAVPANQWVHVAIVYGNGGMRAYANGALIQTYSNASGPIVDALPVLNDFRIGGRQSGGHYFAGSIDEVRVYNRALTATEVRGLAGDSVQYVYGLDLISQKRNGTTRYYGYDGLGSVRYVADDAGLVVDAYTYDAFGILTERKARTSGGTWAWFDISQPETPPPGTTPTVNNYRYTGEQWDQDLGMYYLRARYYKPDFGRFWTMDSYEGSSQDPLSLHKYLYCQGNSVNAIDPSGHESFIGLSIGSTISMSLSSMYNGAVLGTGSALRATLFGIQARQGMNEVLSDFILEETGLGLVLDAYEVVKGCFQTEEERAVAAYILWRENLIATILASMEDDEFGEIKVELVPQCFLAGTLVATEAGLKPIEVIKAGDNVWAWNEVTEELALRPVLDRFIHQRSEIFKIAVGRDTFEVTGEHPFYVSGKGWIPAHQIQTGDRFVTSDDRTLAVSSVAKRSGNFLVYNFEVSTNHNYYVGNESVLTHNANALRAAMKLKDPLLAAHHIVALRAKGAARCRQLLLAPGTGIINLNDIRNGVALPRNLKVKPPLYASAVVHSVVHTTKYWLELETRLQAVAPGKRVRVLQQSAYELLVGTFPH